MKRRYLVIYYDGNETKAAIHDSEDDYFASNVVVLDGRGGFCDITAVVLCADAPNIPYVVIGGECVMGGPEEEKA